MRKDHEGFCFPRFSYGIINILLTSSQRIIPSQAWHNSCSWPPATAEHPGNKFRLPERKKKSILQLILGGGRGGGVVMITPRQGQHHQEPQRGDQRKSVQMSLNTSIWNKWPNDYHPSIPLPKTWTGWHSPQQGSSWGQTTESQPADVLKLSKLFLKFSTEAYSLVKSLEPIKNK